MPFQKERNKRATGVKDREAQVMAQCSAAGNTGVDQAVGTQVPLWVTL